MSAEDTTHSGMARVPDALATPVDIAWLAAFRFLFGMVMFVSMCRFLAYGWINRFFVEPAFHFKYWGFNWVPAPGPVWGQVVFAVLALLALAVALGAWFRVAAPLFTLLFVYVQLIDATTYLNHYYLAALLSFLLAVSPAHRAWSVDALRARRSVGFVPRSWLWLFRFQVGVVYTFAGIAKAHPDWLLSAQPLRIWLSSLTDLPVLGPLFGWDLAAPLMSWAGFLFDSTIVFWMLWRRTRPYAYVVIVVFHALTRALFPIGMFPVIMVLAALVFFPPHWPRALLGRLRRAPATSPLCTAHWRPHFIALALVYAAVQVVLPLRHLAYAGNVLWGEQGMRYSWRVMVREKNGSVTYMVKQKPTQRVWEVSPHGYINRVQENEMAGQPDLILQLAHQIQRDFDSRGLGPVEVRVQALVSLNGRRATHLIDPNVDLTQVRDGVGRAHWILPDPQTPIPRMHSLGAL